MKLVPESTPTFRLVIFSLLPLLLGALVLLRLAPDAVLAVVHCPLRETTGVPCPTCGGTLSLTQLVSGDWRAAFAANPLVFLTSVGFFLTAGYAAAATLVPPWRRALHLTPTEKRTARWLAVLLIVLNWAWLARRYLG
jgi:hypothetical protein